MLKLREENASAINDRPGWLLRKEVGQGSGKHYGTRIQDGLKYRKEFRNKNRGCTPKGRYAEWNVGLNYNIQHHETHRVQGHQRESPFVNCGFWGGGNGEKLDHKMGR